MSDISQQTARSAGRFGVVRGENPTQLQAVIPPDLNAPADYDATLGLTQLGMDGNDAWSNCFWAYVQHARMLQALTGLNDRQQPVFVDGFSLDDPDAAVGWFKTYLASQGTPATEPPGGGTGIYSGAQSILDQGLAYAVGVLGPDQGDHYSTPLVHQAFYEFDGGVGVCLALDDDAMKEFNEHVPWGTLSTKPDASEGHAATGVAYGPTGEVLGTWGTVQGTTGLFDTNCIDGIVLVITQGFILKNGQGAADALAVRWGLTVAAPAEKPQESPTVDPDVTPAPTVKPSGLFDRIRDFIDKEVSRQALKRDIENVVIPEAEALVTDELIKLAERFGI